MDERGERLGDEGGSYKQGNDGVRGKERERVYCC